MQMFIKPKSRFADLDLTSSKKKEKKNSKAPMPFH